MKIKWFGQSYFLITSKDDTKIATDPFDRKLGYNVPYVEADIVTISHDHYDHNCVSSVKGKFTCIDKPGIFITKGIEIVGIETFHDESRGKERGRNIIFNFNIDGLYVCHCGDLGHVLSDDHVAMIGKVDVLLLPVGGTFTVNAAKAFEVVKQLNPTVTIPMHYKTKAVSLPIDGVDKFVSIVGNSIKTGKQEIEIDENNISKFSGVVILEYK